MRLPAVLMRRQLPVVGVLLCGAVYIALALRIAWDKAQDDAAITFAYANNLVNGHGLVLSAGAEPVEGYSNFLWLLLNVPAIAMGWDAITVSKLMGMALSVATIALLARIPGQVEGRSSQGLDLMAPALTAITLPFALWSMSGLENPLQAMLIVLAVSLTIREVKEPHAVPWSFVALFALALNRPDGIVYWVVAVVYRVALITLAGRRSRRDVAWGFGFVIPFLAYHSWHYSYFGELVPNTYFAKADHRSVTDLVSYATDTSDAGFVYLRSFFADYWLLPLLLLVPLALLGRRGIEHYSLPVMMLAAGLVVILYQGGDWMPHYRFMSPLIPLLFLGAQEGLRILIRLGHDWRPQTSSVAMQGALALGVMSIVVVANAVRLDEVRATPFHGEYSVVKAHAQRLEAIAEHLDVEPVSVLAPDIGALAYDTELFVIDLGGLADPFIARHPFGPELMDYIFEERRPDIISTHTPWVKDIDKDARLERDYATVGRNDDENGNLINGNFVRKELVFTYGDCSGAIGWDEAEAFIGQEATIHGLVASGRSDPVTGHVALEIGGTGIFVVAIQQPDRQNFAVPPHVAYVGETICVTGRIQSFLELPIVQARTPRDIIVERGP